MGETHDAGDFVGDEVAWLVLIPGRHQEVLVERVREDTEHQVPARFHARVPCALAPHLQRVREHGVFAGALFVFAVGGLEKPFRPGVAVVPVKGTGEGEERIGRGGVASIPYQGVDPGFVRACGEPAGIEVGDYGSGMDKVACDPALGIAVERGKKGKRERQIARGNVTVVEMVVIVSRVAKVLIQISRVTSTAHYTFPDSVVHQWEDLVIVHETRKSCLQACQCFHC